jgi:hypothetical protein
MAGSLNDPGAMSPDTRMGKSVDTTETHTMFRRLTDRLVRFIRDDRGVATSLIEATATVAVGAVLAGVAVGGAIDVINDSKIQAAISDVQVIGQSVITFYKDNSFYPVFRSGTATGPADDYFNNLASRNGTYPTDQTLTWDIPAAPVPYDSAASVFGHQLGPNDDSIEGHLIANQLGLATLDAGLTFTSAERYPARGDYTGDPQRGWNGPYIGTLTKTDPWGTKYLINVRKLHVRHFQEEPVLDNTTLPSIAVIVLSAGPNRAIETPDDQFGQFFQANGDDIVYRIK